MRYHINTTEQYHIHELDSLGWELTVCNALEHYKPCIKNILKVNESYGNHLVKYLEGLIPMNTIGFMLEIGGGYGYLLRDILKKYSTINAVSLDISEYLIQKQKENQKDCSVLYILNDIFSMQDAFFNTFDFVLLNENMGDFPTVVGIDKGMLELYGDQEILSKIHDFVVKYRLTIPNTERFNFNIGACEIIEKLCRNNVKYVFASEHSCEPNISEMIDETKTVSRNVNPEKICLKGHCEYTVQFSHLQKIADYYGYRNIRGNYTDFIKINNNQELNFIVKSNSQKDDHEIIRHFLEDLLKYEYLLLIKK